MRYRWAQPPSSPSIHPSSLGTPQRSSSPSNSLRPKRRSHSFLLQGHGGGIFLNTTSALHSIDVRPVSSFRCPFCLTILLKVSMVQGEARFGGAVFAGPNTLLSLGHNSSLLFNTALAHGGAVHCEGCALTTPRGLIVSENSAAAAGGGLALTTRAKVSLKALRLTSNAARLGSGVACRSGSSLRLSFAHIEGQFRLEPGSDSTDLRLGAALDAESCASLDVANTVFTHNLDVSLSSCFLSTRLLLLFN